MARVPRRYIPRYLTKKDKNQQKTQLRKSRKEYKQGRYHTRKKVKSFKSKTSQHILNARRIYGIQNISPNRELVKKTKCSIGTLKKIMKKGQGAYFSSGSRPNQTGHSWGYARLASAITGGKASAVDLKLLIKGCKKSSKALKLAKKTKKYGQRRVPKVKIGGSVEPCDGAGPDEKTGCQDCCGSDSNCINNCMTTPYTGQTGGYSIGGYSNGGYKMKERIIKFMKSKNSKKKYTAIVKNLKTKKERPIHFGASDYQQYKDRTPLKLYAHKNHGDRKRMQNYFKRHSRGIGTREKAINYEKNKSKGIYNAKILSHEYLW